MQGEKAVALARFTPRPILDMNKKNLALLALEIVWWLFTGIIVWAILSKIDKAMYVWPFRTLNIIFIVTLITLTRYTFLVGHTFLAKQQILKIVLLLLMFPVTFLLIDKINGFMSYIEEQTWEPITGHLPPFEKMDMEHFIWNEMLFFGVGSIIAAPVFAVRMLISVWRTRNSGTA